MWQINLFISLTWENWINLKLLNLTIVRYKRGQLLWPIIAGISYQQEVYNIVRNQSHWKWTFIRMNRIVLLPWVITHYHKWCYMLDFNSSSRQNSHSCHGLLTQVDENFFSGAQYIPCPCLDMAVSWAHIWTISFIRVGHFPSTFSRSNCSVLGGSCICCMCASSSALVFIL